MKSKLFYPLLIFPYLIISVSCSNSLSRDQAAKIIKASSGLPHKDIRTYNFFQKEMYGFHDTRDNFIALQKKGLLRFEISDGGFGTTILEAYLRNSAQPFVEERVDEEIVGDEGTNIYHVICSTIEFGEITGIVMEQGNSLAQVEYTLIQKNVTPLGSILFGAQPQVHHSSVTFRKYDDGWRIMNN